MIGPGGQCRPHRSPRSSPFSGPAQFSESVHPSTPPSRGFQRWRRRLSEPLLVFIHLHRRSSGLLVHPPAAAAGRGSPRRPAAGGIDGGVQDRGLSGLQTAFSSGLPAGRGRRHFPAVAARGARQAAGVVRRAAQETVFAPARGGAAVWRPESSGLPPPLPGLCWARR